VVETTGGNHLSSPEYYVMIRVNVKNCALRVSTLKKGKKRDQTPAGIRQAGRGAPHKKGVL